MRYSEGAKRRWRKQAKRNEMVRFQKKNTKEMKEEREMKSRSSIGGDRVGSETKVKDDGSRKGVVVVG